MAGLPEQNLPSLIELARLSAMSHFPGFGQGFASVLRLPLASCGQQVPDLTEAALSAGGS